MGRIENWPRVFWRSTSSDEVQEQINLTGSAEIAKWRYKNTDIRCVHIYEPDSERQYIVELRNTNLDADETGRYRTREEGGDANKKLMRKNTQIGSDTNDIPVVDIRNDGEDWLRQSREER
jgi:hypothetical protein